jgi:hypothetical protein
VTAERVSAFRGALFGTDAATLYQYALTDSFNSTLGAYGESNITLQGDVGSNGSILLKDRVTLKGDAIASGSVTKEGVVTISGQVVQGEMKRLLRTVDQNACTQANTASDLTVGNGETRTLEGGTYYVKTLSVGGGAVVEVKNPTTIYVGDQTAIRSLAVVGARPGAVHSDTKDKRKQQSIYEDPTPGELKPEAGEVSQISQSPLQPPPFLTLYVCGTSEVLLNDAAVLSGALYAPNAVVKVRKRGLVFGSIVAKRVEAGTYTHFHYDEALRTKEPGRFRPVAGTWQQLFAVAASSSGNQTTTSTTSTSTSQY